MTVSARAKASCLPPAHDRQGAVFAPAGPPRQERRAPQPAHGGGVCKLARDLAPTRGVVDENRGGTHRAKRRARDGHLTRSSSLPNARDTKSAPTGGFGGRLGGASSR